MRYQVFSNYTNGGFNAELFTLKWGGEGGG